MGNGDLVAQQADSFALPATVQEQQVEVAVARAQQEAQAEIQSACILARKFPRDTLACREKMIEHCQRPKFADKALYSYPRGGTTISGPSINLARTLAQCWGNIRWGIEVIYDTPKVRKIRVWAWDLESNTRVSTEDEFEKKMFRRGKGFIDLDFSGNDDERSIRELTFRKASLILRGCLLNLIPSDFVEDAEQACRESMKGSKENRADRIKTILDAFASIGVTKERIETKIGCAIADIDEDQIIELRGAYEAINDSQATVRDVFPLATAEDDPGPENEPADTGSDTFGKEDDQTEKPAEAVTLPPDSEPVKEAEPMSEEEKAKKAEDLFGEGVTVSPDTSVPVTEETKNEMIKLAAALSIKKDLLAAMASDDLGIETPLKDFTEAEGQKLLDHLREANRKKESE